MKINYFRLSATSLLAVVLGASAQAQTGIGTTSPRTTLDVNGAIAVAEGLAAVSGNAATIPTGFSLVRLTGTATGPIVLTAATSPVVVAGQLLTINNPTAYAATFSGQLISAGQSLSLVYSNSSWQGTAGGGNTALTAGNGLSRSGNNFTLGGALTGGTTISQAGNAFSLTGGHVGIGTTAPAQQLDVSGNVSTTTVGTQPLLRLTRPDNAGVKYASAMEMSLGTYDTSNLSQTRLDFNLANGGTDNPDMTAMSLLGNGNVGIGTSAPATRLQVVSGDNTFGTNIIDAQANNQTYGTSLYYGGVRTTGSSANNALNLDSKGTGGLVLQGNGGGGTVTVGTNLTVNGNAQVNNYLGVSGDVGVGGNLNANSIYARGGLGITTQGAFLQWNRTGAGESWLVNQRGLGTGGLRFGDSDLSNNVTEYARFDGGGNLGLGTGAPAQKLDVTGGNIKISTAGNGLIFPDGSLQTTAATSGDLLTANNGLSRSGNNFTLGGALTGSTNIPLGNNNLILSTGTTGTGVLVLDGQGGGINNNTAKQRIEFTSSSDPNAVIGHTVVAGTNEINDLYMYSGNDTDAGAGPDRIRLVGENILFQNFNNAGISTVANAEANTGTITNMFIGGNGNVGIGTSAPGTKLQVVSGDNSTSTILDVQANNLTQGVGLYYGGVRSTGSNAGVDLNLDSKGANSINMQYNGGSGNVNVNTNLYVNNNATVNGFSQVNGSAQVNGNLSTNSLYAWGNRGIAGQGAYLQWNRTGGGGETWLLNQRGGGGGGIRFGQSDASNNVTEFAQFDGGGNLGLGTGSPSQKLDVNGNIHLANNLLMENAQTMFAANAAGAQEPFFWPRFVDNMTYLNYGSGGFNIRNNGSTPTMFMTNGGSVGIGTTGPASTLDVRTGDGSARITVGTTGGSGGGIALGNPGHGLQRGFPTLNGDNNVGLYTTGGNVYLSANGSGTTNHFVLANNGNVGIGTSGPGAKLQVVSADNNFGTNIIDAQANNQTQGVGLYYGGVRSTGSNPSVDLNLDSKGSGGLNLQRNGGGGNVTVGTNLTVNGNAQVNNYLGVNGDVGVGGNLNANSLYARANTGISGQGAYLQWNRSGGDGETWLINQQGGGGGNAGIRFGRSDASNNLTEFARFSNNGNFSVASGNKGITLDPTSNGSDVLLSLRSASTGNWARIGSNGSPLAFITQGSDAGGGAAMTINNDGTVGIGLTSPAATLDVNGSTIVRNGLHIISNGGPTLDITTTTAAVSSVPAFNNVVYDVSGWENHIFGGHVVPRDDNSMNLGIPQSRWATVYAVNGTIQTSDGRLKTNIVNSGYGLGTVMKMRPVTYNWKTAPTSNPMVGFIAQEMETLVPEAVDVPKTAAEHYGMKYNQLIPVLTKAIQEQQAQIEILTAANAGLKAELADKASASTVNELQAALQSLRAEMQGQAANHATARAK